jgi:phenylalanyl-tRNA synthetase beta chain
LRLGPKTVLARFGALHPTTLAAFDVAGPVMAVELFLEAIPAKKGGGGFARAAYAPPALQPLLRDFAFLVAAELPAADLLRAVKGADKANIVDARVFDLFVGPGVPEGRKSLAIAERVLAAAAKLGAELRG